MEMFSVSPSHEEAVQEVNRGVESLTCSRPHLVGLPVPIMAAFSFNLLFIHIANLRA